MTPTAPVPDKPRTETDYPHNGTCDMCAEGSKPLREADPETEAWICRECSDRIDAAISAAAEAMGVTVEVADTGITAYFKVSDPPEVLVDVPPDPEVRQVVREELSIAEQHGGVANVGADAIADRVAQRLVPVSPVRPQTTDNECRACGQKLRCLECGESVPVSPVQPQDEPKFQPRTLNSGPANSSPVQPQDEPTGRWVKDWEGDLVFRGERTSVILSKHYSGPRQEAWDALVALVEGASQPQPDTPDPTDSPKAAPMDDRDPCPICDFYGHPASWHDDGNET